MESTPTVPSIVVAIEEEAVPRTWSAAVGCGALTESVATERARRRRHLAAQLGLEVSARARNSAVRLAGPFTAMTTESRATELSIAVGMTAVVVEEERIAAAVWTAPKEFVAQLGRRWAARAEEQLGSGERVSLTKSARALVFAGITE